MESEGAKVSSEATAMNVTEDRSKAGEKVSEDTMAINGVAVKEVATRKETIRQKLETSLNPIVLKVEDVSYQHAGHAGVQRGASETHFNLKIVSPMFEGKTLVKRHRLVYELLQEELQNGLHALSIVAKTPAEAERA